MIRFVLALGFCLLSLLACGDDEGKPCLTRNAVRDKDDFCVCPDGTHIEVSTCVPDERVDIAPSTPSDGGGKVDSSTASDAGEMDASIERDAGASVDSSHMAAQSQDHEDDANAAPQEPANTGTPVAMPPACVPTAETCDGTDNDCDGVVDEEASEAPIGASCTNGGQGACARPGKQTCFMGKVVCDAPMPQPEDCDGIDNDCKNGVDDGLTNACGGSQCGADLSKLGADCTAGQGDCQGIGKWACDSSKGNNELRCTAVEKPKNACGVTCGPVPAEDCSTPGDDNCNGETNEGCCGDGKVTVPEKCDPETQDGTWTCNDNCTIKTIYRPCTQDADCSTAGGEFCHARLTFCTKACSAREVMGPNSGCPTPGGGLSALCASDNESAACVAAGCPIGADSSNKTCGPGASCVGSGGITACVGFITGP